MHACMHTYTRSHTHIHAHARSLTHTHTHTHKHTNIQTYKHTTTTTTTTTTATARTKVPDTTKKWQPDTSTTSSAQHTRTYLLQHVVQQVQQVDDDKHAIPAEWEPQGATVGMKVSKGHGEATGLAPDHHTHTRTHTHTHTHTQTPSRITSRVDEHAMRSSSTPHSRRTTAARARNHTMSCNAKDSPNKAKDK
jgi:hypothetical protein